MRLIYRLGLFSAYTKPYSASLRTTPATSTSHPSASGVAMGSRRSTPIARPARCRDGRGVVVTTAGYRQLGLPACACDVSDIAFRLARSWFCFPMCLAALPHHDFVSILLRKKSLRPNAVSSPSRVVRTKRPSDWSGRISDLTQAKSDDQLSKELIV